MLKGVEGAINKDGLFTYEWGRDKPLSDALCWTGYTLGAMCLLGETEIAKRLMKGLLWMEELTGKPGYLPRCVYYGDKKFDYIQKVVITSEFADSKVGQEIVFLTDHDKFAAMKELGIWNNTSQDQYLGLFFGLHFASQSKSTEINRNARKLEMIVTARLIKDNMRIKNEDGKTCKFGKLNRFYQHVFFPDMKWNWRDKIMLKLMPLMKFQDTLKRIVGSRLNRSNYFMILCGLFLICQHKPEMKRYFKSVYKHVRNEENFVFNAMYNKLFNANMPVDELIEKISDKNQYVSKNCVVERDYIVPIEDRPVSHWYPKESPVLEQYGDDYTNRWTTRADCLLALAIQGMR